jgi:hypothetical protein
MFQKAMKYSRVDKDMNEATEKRRFGFAQFRFVVAVIFSLYYTTGRFGTAH